jgi:hypothetical protein
MMLLCFVILNACAPTPGSAGVSGQQTMSKKQGVQTNQPIKASSKSTGTNQAAFDPCELISKDDIAQALGGAVNLQPDIITPLCEFALAAKGSTSSNKQSEIAVSVGSSEDASSYMALDRLSSGQPNGIENVPNLGDRAFLIKTSMGPSIVVEKGSIIYSITYLNPTQQGTRARAIIVHLAQLASKSLATTTPTLPIPDPQPCVVLNGQQASQLLLNKPVKRLSMVNDAGVSSCTYLSTAGAQQQVQIVITANGRAAKPVYQTARAYVDPNRLEDLPGLGDAAFYDGVGSLWILKKDTVFHISVFDSPATEAQIVGMGQKALTFFV